jgi:hypothetical protein
MTTNQEPRRAIESLRDGVSSDEPRRFDLGSRVLVHGCEATMLSYEGEFARVRLHGGAGGTMTCLASKLREPFGG